MRGRRSKEELECSTRVHKNETGINDLPEHILHHIFSFLDTKQTIQTCILSRKWRYFWISIPTLNFNYSQQQRREKGRKKGEIKDFVDLVLMFRDNSNIQGFVLVSDERISHLNTWILVCVLRNVQQLTLDTYFPETFQFHHCLFTCKSLTKLVLRAYHPSKLSLTLPYSVTLPSLKTLCLLSVKFEDEYSTNQLFSGCPILESLTIDCCEFPHINVNLSSSLLQRFEVSLCTTKSNALDLGPNFQLCTPNLISFYWFNDLSIHCDPKNLSSLVDASIYLCVDSMLSKEKKAMHAPFMVNLFRGLHNVEDLTLSASFLEVITGAPDLLDSQPMKFCNLRCLKLMGTWFSRDCIPAISYLQKMSPNIETLSIEDLDPAGNADTDLLDKQPTQFCNVRCLKMDTMVCRDCIYEMTCLIKICPNTETLSYTVYYEDYSSYDEIMNPYCDEINSDRAIKKDYKKTVLSLECLLNHLKYFELRDVTGRIDELEFLEILLKNTMVLEKLLIVFKTTYSDTSGRQIKFSEKVLTFPRASPSVVILFKFSENVL